MKYYVKSNNLNVVVMGEHIKSPMDAACEAFLTHYQEGMLVSPLTIVSERGFDYHDHDHNEDFVLDSIEVLAKAGFFIEDDE